MSSPDEEESGDLVELSPAAAPLLAQFKAATTPDGRRRDRIFGRVCVETEESTRSSDESDEADEGSSTGNVG